MFKIYISVARQSEMRSLWNITEVSFLKSYIHLHRISLRPKPLGKQTPSAISGKQEVIATVISDE